MSRGVIASTGICKAVTVLLSGMMLFGCDAPSENAAESAQTESTSVPSAVPVDSLADTQWQLVEFQSMDDAAGTQRPNDPSQYTMRLNQNGTVQFQLNCNLANGTWSAETGPDPASGHFEFGPLAATSAVCPPPSMDELISSQTQYVRSYLKKDGRLYLSLMADGGIYVWEPISEQSFQTKSDRAIEEAILQASPYYTRSGVDMEGGVGRGRYVYNRVDLNDDGQDEVLVYLLGSIFCGTGGCNLMLFKHETDGYVLVNDFPISRPPIIGSSEKTKGWHDLWRLESGGGVPSTYVRHVFDGKQYVEQERVPANEVPEGQTYLSNEITFDKGIPLEPLN